MTVRIWYWIVDEIVFSTPFNLNVTTVKKPPNATRNHDNIILRDHYEKFMIVPTKRELLQGGRASVHWKIDIGIWIHLHDVRFSLFSNLAAAG